MRGNIQTLWNLFLMLMVCLCHAGKRRDKTRDKSSKIHDKDKHMEARASKFVSDVMHEICLPSNSDRLVYRYENNSHIFIGFDDIKKDTVYTMSWKISRGNPEALASNNKNGFQTFPAEELRKHVTTEHLLAAANQKLQEKFLDNISTCSQSIIISKACVIQSFAVLARKMKEVTFGTPCSKGQEF